eukprot:3524429-Pyramimonas_sp.AAC.1
MVDTVDGTRCSYFPMRSHIGAQGPAGSTRALKSRPLPLWHYPRDAFNILVGLGTTLAVRLRRLQSTWHRLGFAAS